MPRQFWRRVLLLALSACGGSLLLAQTNGPEEALPIQRIIVQPKHVAQELDKVRQGALLLMPLAEFEERVERIRKAMQAREAKPRLTRAHYSAELIDRALTNGSGQWTIAHPGTTEAILPIGPINLALHRAKWEAGGDALLADFDGKSLGLHVKPGANATCLFDWSLRGRPTNDGIAFKLAAPPCPISTFELRLPTDAWLSVPKDAALVTGPHETETPAKRVWRLQTAGSKPIEMLVRTMAPPKGPAPTIFARTHSEQRLAADGLEVEHDFQIDIPHGSLTALTLEGDAGLQPYEVTLKGGEVKSFQWTEGAPSKDPKAKGGTAGQLTIHFPQPVQGRIQGLHVRSLAPRPSGGVWTSPFLRVKGAVSRGETLVVHLAPDLPLGRWDHGTFQPTYLETRADGTQVLTLADTAAAAPGSRRPTLIAPIPSLDLRTLEAYDWRITPHGATLGADLQFIATQGRLFELRVKLPKTFPGYQLESLDLQPAGMLRGWQLEGGFVVVELKQALAPMKKVDLKIRLRSGFRELTSGIRVLAYPEMEPMGVVKRAGSVTIHVAPIFQAQLVAASLPLASTQESASAPAPSYRFEFREQKLSAAVRLTPQPIQVQLHGKHAILLGEDGARMQFRWEAEALVGAAEHLDFRLPPGFPASWRVVEDGGVKIHRWERLPLEEALPHLLHLGSQNALQAATLRASLPQGTFWRFHLSTPLEKKARFTLETIAPAGRTEDDWRRLALRMPRASAWECAASALAAESLPMSVADKVWALPLMMPVQRANMEQEVSIESQSEPIGKVTADGSLRPVLGASGRGQAPMHAQVRQTSEGSSEPGARINVWTRLEKRAPSALEWCDEAKVGTFVHKDGRVYHRIQFRLWHWRDPTCPLRVPAGHQIVAIRVHDRWLQHFQAETTSTQVRLALPVDQNAEFVRYEILTRSTATGGALPGMMRVETPRIDWPAAPLEVRERWFMEAGLTPLHQETLAPVGVPSSIAWQTETPRRLRQAWSWGEWWWPVGAATAEGRRLDEQRQIVLSAEADLRKTAPAGKAMKLAQALENLAIEHLKEATPLIVDRVAFRSLGLSVETLVPAPAMFERASRPFWDALGLVYLPCPDGALLTSPARLESLGIRHPTRAAELNPAVQEAIRHGRDDSAGFSLVVAWLNSPPDDMAEFPLGSMSPTAAHPWAEVPGMIEWQILSDGPSPDGFWVVDPPPARAVGWLGAIMLAIGLWRIGRSFSPLAVFRVYLFLIAVGVLVAIWLPIQVREFFACPALLVSAVGFLWHLIRVVGRGGATSAGGASTVSHVVAGAAVVGAVFFSVTWQAPAQAQAARTYTVLVIDGPKPAALITPDLLARLEELENRPEFAGRDAVLTRAKYVGKFKDGLATFEADYEIQSFQPKANLVIPLQGVQLQEGAYLDGAPVFPTAKKNGYGVTIRDRGPHRLRLIFTARAATVGDQQELRFTIPNLIQSEMALQWLAPVQAIHCLQCVGAETHSPPAPQAGKEWHGQLGYDGAVHFRWRKISGLPAAKAFDVKEAHYWDLRPGSLALLTSLNYALGKDSLTQLTVALPEGLHLRSVDAAALPAAGAPAAPVVIKHWTVLGKGGQRRLAVEFAESVSGNVTLNLDIVPQAFGQKRQLSLQLPAPLQGKSKAGILGYRLDAVEIQPKAPNLADVQSISPDEFEQQWKKHGAPPIPVSASRAYTIRRVAIQAGLELGIEPSDRKAQVHAQWSLERHYAQVKARCDFTSSREDLMLLEFFVDKALVLADVTGPDVARWHAHESHLQVWLRQPRKQTTIELTGWPGKAAKAGGPPLKSLALPAVYPLHTRIGDSSLVVRPAPDLQVTTDARRGLRPDASDPLRLTIQEFPYEAIVQVTPRSKVPDATLLTRLNASDRGVEIVHGIRLTSERGALPALKLHVKDWPHGRFQLEAQGASAAPASSKVATDAVWTLKYPAGLPHEVFITLRGRWPKEAPGPIVLPTVSLEGATIRQHWLAWKDVELHQAPKGKKLTPLTGAKDQIGLALADRWFNDFASWKVAEAVKGRTEVSLPKTPPRGNVRILAWTDETRRIDPPAWLREVSWLVHAPEGTELRFKFPATVSALGILLNDRPQVAWNPGADEFAFALEPGPAPRWVKVRWKYADGDKKMNAPNLAGPTINQAALPAGDRWLLAPPGASVVRMDSAGASTLVERLLAEAQARLQITAVLAEESPRTAETARLIAAERAQLHALLRQAEYAAAVLRSVPNDGADVPWRDRGVALKRKHQDLAKERRLDDDAKAKQIVRMPATTAAFDHFGTPVLLPVGLSSVNLESAAERRSAEQRTATELLLVAAIFLLVFSYFRQGLLMLRAAAPEITIVLAGIGIWFGGLSLIGAFLIAAMLVVRGVRFVSVWRRPRAPAPPAAEARTAPPGPPAPI